MFEWRKAIAGSGLSPAQRGVSSALALHMDRAGDSCYPSLETLAAESGYHRATVIRAVKDLDAAGWIERDLGGGLLSRTDAKRTGRSTRYRATVPVKPSSSATVRDEPNGASNRRTPQPSHSATVALDSSNRRPLRPEVSIEESIRTSQGEESSNANPKPVAKEKTRDLRASLVEDGFAARVVTEALDAYERTRAREPVGDPLAFVRTCARNAARRLAESDGRSRDAAERSRRISECDLCDVAGRLLGADGVTAEPVRYCSHAPATENRAHESHEEAPDMEGRDQGPPLVERAEGFDVLAYACAALGADDEAELRRQEERAKDWNAALPPAEWTRVSANEWAAKVSR